MKGIINVICLIILLILCIVWINYHEKAHSFISLESKKSYKNLTRYIKKNTKYKWIAIPANIIIIVASFYLCFAVAIIGLTILLALIIFLFVVGTLGILLLADYDILEEVVQILQMINPVYLSCSCYLLILAIIIKNIFFNIELYKFLNNNEMKIHTKRFCTNCGTEVTENFCTNCGKKV